MWLWAWVFPWRFSMCFGWAWLMVAGHLSAEAAFAAAVAPFVLIDVMKMVAAVLIAQAVSAVVAR